MKDEDFKLFMEGVKEMVEHYHGLRHDLRTTILPMPPEPMDAAAIRALRERIGTSQAVFAMALNVSTKTVQAWESGARTPDGGNLRLLRVAEARPEVVFGSLYQQKAMPLPESAMPARQPPAPQGASKGAGRVAPRVAGRKRPPRLTGRGGRSHVHPDAQQRPSALGQVAGLQLTGQVAHVFPHVNGQV